MDWRDIVNGCFETMGSIFILMHCFTLYKDKMVRGVNIRATAGFFLWGLWNVYYYPSLNQTFSFIAGLAVCLSNLLWITLMIYYSSKEKTNERNNHTDSRRHSASGD